MNNKYLEIAVGWLRQGKKGEYISATTAKGNPARGRPAVKLIAELDNGERVEVSNFAMFFNENKVNEKAPDVQFVVTLSE